LVHSNFGQLVKSRNSIEFVIPAKAGIQLFQDILDPGFRRGDDPRDFLRDHQFWSLEFIWDLVLGIWNLISALGVLCDLCG
jgi:hypothetical protein